MTQKIESPAGKAGQELNEQSDIYNLLSSSAKSKFLDLFPANKRSRITNGFCWAVRSGCSDPYSIVTHVLCESRRERTHDLHDAIGENYAAALEFAECIIGWEELSAEAKKEIKRERSAEYREAYLKKQPPTDKQVKYLRALGYREEVLNRWEASKLIDELTKK